MRLRRQDWLFAAALGVANAAVFYLWLWAHP